VWDEPAAPAPLAPQSETAPSDAQAEPEAESEGGPAAETLETPEAEIVQKPEAESVDAPRYDEDSDFILDLEDIAAAAPGEPVGYQATDPHVVADKTCDDCIYVDTCPNKDQREPASCGSFVWK